MIGAMSILALAATGAGLMALRAIDPKRRRVFGLPPTKASPARWIARPAVWLPGIALIAAGQESAFVIWLGGATVLGWGVAAMTPAFIQRIRSEADAMHAWVRAKADQAGDKAPQIWAQLKDYVAWVGQSLPKSAATRAFEARIALLEARVAELEACLERQEALSTAPSPIPEQRPLSIAGSYR
ncbi:MAG: hypothetical protein AAF844_21285 [Pseudomonadota bacterium]